MKNRAPQFWLFPVGLVSLRATDVAITYAVSPDLRWEINPLVSVAGQGWFALIAGNVLGVAAILALFRYWLRRSADLFPGESGYSLKEFISHYLFGERHSFHKIYYVVPSNRKAILEYCGYVFIRVLTVWSFIVVVHNALVWHSAHYRDVMAQGKLWLVIYALLVILTPVFSWLFFRYLYREYNAMHGVT